MISSLSLTLEFKFPPKVSDFVRSCFAISPSARNALYTVSQLARNALYTVNLIKGRNACLDLFFLLMFPLAIKKINLLWRRRQQTTLYVGVYQAEYKVSHPRKLYYIFFNHLSPSWSIIFSLFFLYQFLFICNPFIGRISSWFYF